MNILACGLMNLDAKYTEHQQEILVQIRYFKHIQI